jgi:hypothetical protein
MWLGRSPLSNGSDNNFAKNPSLKSLMTKKSKSDTFEAIPGL